MAMAWKLVIGLGSSRAWLDVNDNDCAAQVANGWTTQGPTRMQAPGSFVHGTDLPSRQKKSAYITYEQQHCCANRAKTDLRHFV